jgi:hypothetical protein
LCGYVQDEEVSGENGVRRSSNLYTSESEKGGGNIRIGRSLETGVTVQRSIMGSWYTGVGEFDYAVISSSGVMLSIR